MSVFVAGSPALIEGLFRSEGGTTVLLGGRSRSSELTHFPRRRWCPYTGADDVEPVDLPTEGTLWAITTVSIPPPGYHGPVPYALGIVELTDGLRVVGRVIGPAGPAGRVGGADPSSPAGRVAEDGGASGADRAGEVSVGCPMSLTTDRVADGDGRMHTVWAFEPAARPRVGTRVGTGVER